MNPQPPSLAEPPFNDSRLAKSALTPTGIAIRVFFFSASVVIGLLFITSLLLTVFGTLIAGTVGLCATGLFANLLTMRIFDRRPFADIGLGASRASAWNLALGLLFGGGSAVLMLLAPLLAGSGHLVLRQRSEFTWPGLLFYLVALLIAAVGEEMIFRGYAFQLLVEKIGPFATILPVSIIFGLTHSSNPNVTPLGLANTAIWGVLLGYAFLRSRDLWLPIGLHYGWNAVLPLFGVNLSGLTIDVTRYIYRWDLRPIWSGGAYGPEGGLLATIFAVMLFWALTRAPVRGQTAGIAPSLNEPI